MDSLDKIVPQAPQPDAEMDHDAVVDAPEDYDRADMIAVDDQPARDVGGEVGRKAPRFNAWQIAGFVAGGVAVAAGIAAVVYMRARQRQDGAKISKSGLDYADRIRSGLEQSRDRFNKAPLVRSAREKVSGLFH